MVFIYYLGFSERKAQVIYFHVVYHIFQKFGLDFCFVADIFRSTE